jgi:GR25 family glycosyltransferase involved in LPS biosynthesis
MAYVQRTQDKLIEEWFPELQNIFIISIRPERMQRMKDRLGPLVKYIRPFEATNGRLIDYNAWLTAGRFSNTLWKKHPVNVHKIPFTRGELGCFDSHRNIWKEVIDKKLSHALILEDDSALMANWSTYCRLYEIFNEIKQNKLEYDVLYLARHMWRLTYKKKITTNIVVPINTAGAMGYVVTLRGAQILYDNSKVIQHAVDIFLPFMGEQGQLKLLAVHPPVFDIEYYFRESDTRDIR